MKLPEQSNVLPDRMPPTCVSTELQAVAVAAGLDRELAELDLELGILRAKHPETAAGIARLKMLGCL